MFAVVITLLTTLVVRLFAVFLLFSPVGAVDQLLTAIDVLREPVLLVTNLFGSTAGQVYTMFPYTVMPIYSVLATLNEERLEAARDLGATELQSFREVVLPQMRAGLFASALIAFIISLQEFVMTLFLSGQDTRTIPVLAWISISQVLDPIVSVVSTLLIGVVSVLLLAAAALVGLDRIAKQL
jgi:ABC-type spermidine/putrescine transport system permease subunit I